MKTSYQTLLRVLLLGFLFLGAEAFAADQSWMVKITTKTDTGETITGSGYLVKVGDKTFVRTASHVTLGNENVELMTGNGIPLTINKGKGLSHNSNDDQLISVAESDLQVLGTYNKSAKAFIVDPTVYKKASDSDLKKPVEAGKDSAFYLVPTWTRGQAGEFSSKGLSLLNRGRVDSKKRDTLRLSQNKKVGMVDTKIIPGESGSALIKMNENGDAYIYGHAQSFQRAFDHSSFSAPASAQEIVERIEKGQTGRVDDTEWKRKNGVFYRENDEAREANFLSLVAGDGIIAGGGDGIIAGGGDGIIAGGGASKTRAELPTFGMTYKDKMTYAFKVSSLDKNGRLISKHYYANWDNYSYVKELQKKNPALAVEALTVNDPMEMTILQRAFANKPEQAKLCSINQDALLDGFIEVTLPGFESLRVNISSPEALRDFSPIKTLKRSTKDRGEWTLDLRGLFATDVSDTGEEVDTAFITLKHPDYKHVKVKCALQLNMDSVEGSFNIASTQRDSVQKALSVLDTGIHHSGHTTAK